MGDHDSLLAAVCAAPDDDLPRLVLADWYEEHGEAARAEFIRVQCELAAGVAEPLLAEREAELLAAHGTSWGEPIRQLGVADRTEFSTAADSLTGWP